MNNELRTGRFFTADCAECSDVVGGPGSLIMTCDYCEKTACEDCFRNVWKECPDCGRRGCRKHFDGMYCLKCIEHGDE
jgi:hypothetical protein